LESYRHLSWSPWMRYPIDPLYYAAIHRFGSSLITHVHFRACVVDGVFKTVADDANADPATPPNGIVHPVNGA